MRELLDIDDRDNRSLCLWWRGWQVRLGWSDAPHLKIIIHSDTHSKTYACLAIQQPNRRTKCQQLPATTYLSLIKKKKKVVKLLKHLKSRADQQNVMSSQWQKQKKKPAHTHAGPWRTDDQSFYLKPLSERQISRRRRCENSPDGGTRWREKRRLKSRSDRRSQSRPRS